MKMEATHSTFLLLPHSCNTAMQIPKTVRRMLNVAGSWHEYKRLRRHANGVALSICSMDQPTGLPQIHLDMLLRMIKVKHTAFLGCTHSRPLNNVQRMNTYQHWIAATEIDRACQNRTAESLSYH